MEILRKFFCRSLAALAVLACVNVMPAHAAIVPLQNITATASQFGATNLLTDNTAGWAVGGGVNATGIDSTVVFETVSDLGLAGGTALTFTLKHNFVSTALLNLGNFRLSATTDDRSTFADGLNNGGDVTATWIVLDPLTFSASGGATFTESGSNSLLLSGTNPSNDTYTVTANTLLTAITGFRLEALADASLPGSGPGRAADGNFVLTFFEVDAVAIPEPSAFMLMGLALVGLAGFRARNRK